MYFIYIIYTCYKNANIIMAYYEIVITMKRKISYFYVFPIP